MKNFYRSKRKDLLITLCIFLSVPLAALAQEDKIKFGAVSRAFQENNRLDQRDTLNIDHTGEGHVMIDLGVNVNPDKRTEIQAILRFRSDLGGFFGAGSLAQLRQLYVKGILGNFLNYQVGDIYLQLSKYTLHNDFSEGSINEGRIFSDLRRDYAYYENLNRENFWWQQGAHTNFALAFENQPIERIRFDAFFLRNRSAAYGFALPSRFQAGGKMTVTQSKNLQVAVNYINLFDIAATVGSEESMRNPVTSLEIDYDFLNQDNLNLGFFGEGGFSQLTYAGDTTFPPTRTDIFYEAGLKMGLPGSRLKFRLSYRYVGPEFFSAGAQTKRINFGMMPTVFPIYGNDPFAPNFRGVTMFDMIRDPRVYNAIITEHLMPYDPRYGNAMPYGVATPNRQGFTLQVNHADSLERVSTSLTAAMLSDAVPMGSENRRNFLLVRASATGNIHKFINFQKRLILNAGIQYENTSRGGDLDKINFNSMMADLGLEWEILKRLDLLAGLKMLNARGNEFIPIRNQFNEIIDFNNTLTHDIRMDEMLVAAGLKYRFSNNIYITVQHHFFDITNHADTDLSYNISQWVIFFNMMF